MTQEIAGLCGGPNPIFTRPGLVNIAKVDKKHGFCQFCQRFAMDLLPNWTDFRFFVNFVNKETIFR